jgi:hypothetical protein
VVASSAYIANISTPMVLKQINCDLTYTTKTFFFADGSNLRYISNGSKLLPNLYPSTPTASRLLGIDSRDLDYIGLLANINSPLLGDMVRCSNASEPLGKGLFYYNGTAWVKITG